MSFINYSSNPVLRYKDSYNAGVPFKKFKKGLHYWDTNQINSISSFDSVKQQFEALTTGVSGPIVTQKFNLENATTGTQINGYLENFCIKMKGYIKFPETKKYYFAVESDDDCAVKIGDYDYRINNVNVSFWFERNFSKGYVPFEFYFAERNGYEFYGLYYMDSNYSNPTLITDYYIEDEVNF